MRANRPRCVARLTLILVTGYGSIFAIGASDLSGELLTRVGAEPEECAEEIRRMFRPTVRLVCGSVEEELKEFRKTWKAATEAPDDTSTGLVAATRWFRQSKQWRRRYYWMGQTPLLAMFDTEQRRVVLASYDVHAVCRERARQRRVEFRETGQWQREGLTLTRTHHVSPDFPHPARLAQKSGVVLLWAVVDESGAVVHLCVVGASPRGHGFELAAMDAVGQWTYEPALLDDRPVPLELLTRVTFELGTQPLPHRDLLDPLFREP